MYLAAYERKYPKTLFNKGVRAKNEDIVGHVIRTEINNLDLKKAECTNHVLILSKRIDEFRETVDLYESSLSEKMEEIAFLNQQQKRLN
jgi:hypothetical protein